MGCSKIVNKKIWPWIILGFALIIAFCVLFVFGMIDFFGAKSYDWDSNGSVTIIDQARKTKGITELVFCGITFVATIIVGFGGYALSFVKDGQHANNYIVEEAKLMYDAALKKAKKEIK